MKDHPCMADMEKFCKDVKGGHGEKMKCIREHKADLSAACKEKMAKEHEKKAEIKEHKKDTPKPAAKK